MPSPRFRFAPSPTGFLHVGGARTALFNWALTQRLDATFVLRIEDTDEARNRPEWTRGIIDALAWIGIHADDTHFEGPLFQSHYAEQHVAAAERLYESGLAYYCDLTSDEVEARARAAGRAGYDGYSRDRGLGPGSGRVLRFRTPDEGVTVVDDVVRGPVEFANELIEDFVLLRGNGTPMFLLANVVDDMAMDITHVVRAEEHLPNTPKQQMLWQALGRDAPAWAHVPVLVNEQRKKLSKRRDKVALEQYRGEGYLAAAMVNYLMTLGWHPPGESEIVPWATVVESFRLEDVTHSPAFFDPKKLAAFNAEYIRRRTPGELARDADPWIPADWDRTRVAELVHLVQERVTTLADVAAPLAFMFSADPQIDDAAFGKVFSDPTSVAILDDVIVAFTGDVAWEAAALKAAVEAAGAVHGVKPGKAQAPVRVAVTGTTVGPPLYEPLAVLGRDEVVRRLRRARERIGS
jgi:glutamyl-tRNA synthetase